MNEEVRQQAKVIAREAVREIFETLGLDVATPEERHLLRRDFLWIRKARRGSEDINRLVMRSAIGVGVSALLYVLWSGIKTALSLKTGGP